MTTVGRRSLADRLEGVAGGCPDLDTLAARVFAAVGEDVAFAFGCLAVTDPATGLVSRAFKSHPLPLDDEGFAAAEYGAPDVNQMAEIARRPVPVGVLSVDTGGDVQSCRRMREYLTPQFGHSDELRLMCRTGDTVWGALGLYRGAGEAPFTARDGRTLGAVHELLAQAIQRTLFLERAAAPQDPAAGAVLIVGPDDRLRDLTPAAREHASDLGPWDERCLPASVLSAVTLARRGEEPVSTRALGRSGRWLVVRALALEGAPDARSVVVTIDPAPATAIGALTLAARGLTAREQDVARLVLQGASTRGIAAALFLSEHTVQDHLKAIFRKLGVGSRREMIARLALD